MIANYHTHTHRCNHAIGREEDYVREALKAGLKILGWADRATADKLIMDSIDRYWNHKRNAQ